MSENEARPMTVAEAGRKGGLKTHAKHGSEFYEEIGRKGGAATKKKYGPAFYEAIGKKGGSVKAAAKALALIAFVFVGISVSGCTDVHTGNRGIVMSWNHPTGEVKPEGVYPLPPGFGWEIKEVPVTTTVHEIKGQGATYDRQSVDVPLVSIELFELALIRRRLAFTSVV